MPPRKLGLFLIWISSFFSSGSSKKAFPWSITSCISVSSMLVFLMYKKPTSRRAFRSDSRKFGLVCGLRASDKSSIGIELKDIFNGKVRRYRWKMLRLEKVWRSTMGITHLHLAGNGPTGGNGAMRGFTSANTAIRTAYQNLRKTCVSR